MRLHVNVTVLQVPNHIAPPFKFWMRTHVNIGVHVDIVVQITFLILLHGVHVSPSSESGCIYRKSLTASRVNVSVLKFLFLFVQEHHFQ